jgi:hypothetical protein
MEGLTPGDPHDKRGFFTERFMTLWIIDENENSSDTFSYQPFVMKIWERSSPQYSFIRMFFAVNNLETCFNQQFNGSRNGKRFDLTRNRQMR